MGREGNAAQEGDGPAQLRHDDVGGPVGLEAGQHLRPKAPGRGLVAGAVGGNEASQEDPDLCRRGGGGFCIRRRFGRRGGGGGGSVLFPVLLFLLRILLLVLLEIKNMFVLYL